ncbi:MAG: hypothetical protein JW915_23155 [Chitinispirillaceae bacterium]|nr:hypothetical protein [Chitinispirillaceae bacterium]
MIIPEPFLVMGALGRLTCITQTGQISSFIGFDKCIASDFESKGFVYEGCTNRCEIVEILRDSSVIAHYGGRCGKWD